MKLELFDTKTFSYELCKKLLGEWADLLYEEINSKYMVDLSNFIRRERYTKTIYPKPDEVFRIYKELAPKDVKVIMLGQD